MGVAASLGQPSPIAIGFFLAFISLTLGVTFCMLSALVFLPALLQLRDQRRLRQTKPVRRAERFMLPLAEAA